MQDYVLAQVVGLPSHLAHMYSRQSYFIDVFPSVLIILKLNLCSFKFQPARNQTTGNQVLSMALTRMHDAC